LLLIFIEHRKNGEYQSNLCDTDDVHDDDVRDDSDDTGDTGDEYIVEN
jgi:hypothetical protein